MRIYISKHQKKQVIERANSTCEYCRLNQVYAYLPFQIEHIIAIKHGGGSELANLALACPHCNNHKGSDLTTFLDTYDNIVSLYNPRKELWSNHFETTEGMIHPLTDVGRATIKLLKLNEPERLAIRKILASAGLYP